jgi:hypothetical protein
MSLNYGYRYGGRNPTLLPVKASEVWTVGDMISLDSNGYAQPCAAGEKAVGVAMGDVTTVTTPGTDGGLSSVVDCSADSVYLFIPDSGTVTQALVGKTCDVGGAQSIDIDASADDCILIRAVDTVANTLLVSIVAGTIGGVA